MCCAVCVSQGERGHAFYIVESGQLSAFKDNATLPVLSYGPGVCVCYLVFRLYTVRI